MTPRLDYGKAAPGAIRSLVAIDRYLSDSGLEKSLLHLVKLRSSQINRCAYCIDTHSKEARAAGETEQRLYGLSAWQDAPFYTDKERVALAWTESLTLISDHHVSDELYQQARAHFNETELVNLTLAVIAINAWNRIGISFRPNIATDKVPVAERS